MRGNCVMCGRSGPLGHFCSNICRYNNMSVTVIRRNAEQRQVYYQKDPDLQIKRGHRCRYRIMLTPEKENMIDAAMFAELMYKGVDSDQRNYKSFMEKTPKFQAMRHDRILSCLQRWEDPWAFVFPLDGECDWWMQLDFLTREMNLNLENPQPRGSQV